MYYIMYYNMYYINLINTLVEKLFGIIIEATTETMPRTRNKRQKNCETATYKKCQVML